MADPDAVPAGKYGKAALEHLKIWDEVAGNIAATDNVRAALALVESGEAPLGIVYATDAAASGKVRVVATFPAGSHPPIRYSVAILATSKSGQADSFEHFLKSTRGKAIFARYGFIPL
jgi:molybdate transport system substrate-binding protein